MCIFEKIHDQLEFRLVDETSDPEVPGAFFLPEPTSRHQHDPSVVQHIVHLELVGLFALLFGVRHEFLAEIDAREGLHGSLDVA